MNRRDVGRANSRAVLSALAALRDPTVWEIARATNLAEGTVNSHLRSLRSIGRVRYAKKRAGDESYTNRHELAADLRGSR